MNESIYLLKVVPARMFDVFTNVTIVNGTGMACMACSYSSFDGKVHLVRVRYQLFDCTYITSHIYWDASSLSIPFHCLLPAGRAGNISYLGTDIHKSTPLSHPISLPHPSSDQCAMQSTTPL